MCSHSNTSLPPTHPSLEIYLSAPPIRFSPPRIAPQPFHNRQHGYCGPSPTASDRCCSRSWNPPSAPPPPPSSAAPGSWERHPQAPASRHSSLATRLQTPRRTAQWYCVRSARHSNLMSIGPASGAMTAVPGTGFAHMHCAGDWSAGVAGTPPPPPPCANTGKVLVQGAKVRRHGVAVCGQARVTARHVPRNTHCRHGPTPPLRI